MCTVKCFQNWGMQYRTDMGADIRYLSHDNAYPHILPALFRRLSNSDGYFLLLQRDLAHSDFHVFFHITKWCGSPQVMEGEELKTAVLNWLKSQVADYYGQNVTNLVLWHKKCLEINVDYMEK